MRLVALAVCAGCSFHPGESGAPRDGDSGDVGDVGDGRIYDDAAIDSGAFGDVDHVPVQEEYGGDTNWTVSTNTVIDTTTLIVTPPLPSGVTLSLAQQDGGNPIAILRVNDFTVSATRVLSAIGDKPLVVLSSHDVTIAGVFDVGAHGALPGAGGALPGAGVGVGGTGLHDDGTGSTYDDSGGGGGSYGTQGAGGGSVGNFAGGAPGATYLATVLRGGSGGGFAPNPASCTNPPGAGGGVLLLYAFHKITVAGQIASGGGGGAGGISCGAFGYGPGAGGGAGGLVWLQTPDLSGNGVLAANGGGGGGASYSGISDGGPGADGLASTTMVAAGGIKAVSAETTDGGNGAIQGTAASAVPLLAIGNGGGGGGGLGRIVVHAPSSASITSSPTAVSP
jgi:hypothetical protein